MAFIRHDEIKSLNRNPRIVRDRKRPRPFVDYFSERPFFFLFFKFGLITEHRVETLNRRDADLRFAIERVRSQVLHVVKLCELAAIIRRAVRVKFCQGLPAQRATIHQEQHAPGSRKLYQAIDETDRRVSLAASHRHLQQRARPIRCKRCFQILNCLNLAFSQAVFIERRELLQLTA